MTDTTKIILGVVGGVVFLGVAYLALKPSDTSTGGSFSSDPVTNGTAPTTDDGNAVSSIARGVSDITRTIAGVITSDRDRAAQAAREEADRRERREREAADREERLLILRENANRGTSGRENTNSGFDFNRIQNWTGAN